MLAMAYSCMAACKGAAAPPPAKPSNASVTDMFGGAHAASGPSYMAHSNKSGLDYIFVFETRTDPQPDCSMTRDISAGEMPNLDKGGWVSFTFKERLKVGKNAADDDGFISGDKATRSVSMGGGASEGVALAVTKADGKTIEATVTSDGTPKNAASGTIFAVVCPN
jgi:hypothetical protein